MNPVTAPTPTTLPEFSIVMETENLFHSDKDSLFHALQALENQTVSLERANEVIVVNSGVVPDALITQLHEKFPWITVHQAPPETGYYQAKILGANRATGEVVVFCDADCTYAPNWLQEILVSFAQDDVQIMAGETTTGIYGTYSLALGLTYIFPRFSRKKTLYPASDYQANNVAFRRSFLLNHPMVSGLPVFRGDGYIHARMLYFQGHTIWKNPRAQCTHPLPEGFAYLFWRYLLLGHEAMVLTKLLASWRATGEFTLRRSIFSDTLLAVRIAGGRVITLCSRTFDVLRESPGKGLYLIPALPVSLCSLVLFWLGIGLSLFRYDYPFSLYRKVYG